MGFWTHPQWHTSSSKTIYPVILLEQLHQLENKNSNMNLWGLFSLNHHTTAESLVIHSLSIPGNLVFPCLPITKSLPYFQDIVTVTCIFWVSNLYQFPTGTATNYCKWICLKHNNFCWLRFLEFRSHKSVLGIKPRCWPVALILGAPEENLVPSSSWQAPASLSSCPYSHISICPCISPETPTLSFPLEGPKGLDQSTWTM